MAILDPFRWQESVGEHEAVMAAFHARDPERARLVWRRHLLRTGETVCGVLKSKMGSSAAVKEPAPPT
jgi:DNA-binding GntR family transcriptional regulator